MMKNHLLLIIVMALTLSGTSQVFEGVVTDADGGSPLEGVQVMLIEDDSTTLTNASGEFTISALDTDPKTLTLEIDGYMFEQFIDLAPQTGLSFTLREKIQSAASLRMEDYLIDGCAVTPPNDPEWNVTFLQSDLTGGLAPDNTYTRRDPSSVIEVDGTYYVWYSYSLTNDATKDAPWDRNDIYYATSTDGYNWTEEGVAVERGSAGSFDARSVFTTEIFVHEGTYYLVYQAAADADGIYNRNVVGMAYTSSLDESWTKVDEPVLRPSYTDSLLFDNNAVHDPCIILYDSKYHLYYKGECNCMGAADCETWCNPACGLNKQVKWGVAIADNPTGPYVKSVYNPITNTGHEVSIWNYDDGVAILQHQDGPEANTIQYADDGFNFEIMGGISGFPEAPGLFRPNSVITTPIGGVTWGLCHVLKWDAGPNGWMHLRRFDLENIPVEGVNIIQDTLYVQNGTTQQVNTSITPANATNTLLGWTSDNDGIATVDDDGLVTGEILGNTAVRVSTNDGGFTDSVVVVVQTDAVVITQITIEAEDFTSTGGTINDAAWGGPGLGVNATASNINYVNANDWTEYDLTVSTAGIYSIEYQISCPSNGAEISCYFDDELISADAVPNNGIADGWDNYIPQLASGNAPLAAGTYTFKIESSGSETWSWNLDKIVLTRIANLDLSVTDVSVTPETISIEVSETTTITALVEPDYAEDKTVEWFSENQPVATVSTSGLVEGVTPGTANVTVTTNDGDFIATCVVTVTEPLVPVTGVSVTPKAISITVSESTSLTALVTPRYSD